MAKFITHIEELPQERQEALIKGLQSQIIAQAVFVREEQPAKFLSYVDNEIGKADSSMLKMVEESGREGAELCNISEIYIWNKERKKALERLKKEYQSGQQPQNLSPEPQQIPKELSTPEAKKVLQRGITAGLLNDKYQPQEGITRAQQKEFADLASQILKIQKKWVVFRALWSVNNLGQVKTSDADVEKLKMVRRLFPELGFDADGVDIKLKKEKFR